MSIRFRKIDPRIWNDAKFRGLSDDAKLVFLFILTHPNLTSIGAMRATLAGLAAELGWSLKRFVVAMGQLTKECMVEISEGEAWVCCPNFLKYNQPEGPNSVKKAWVAALDLLPECPQKKELIRRVRNYLLAQSEDFRRAIGNDIWHAFGDAISDAKSDPSPIVEVETATAPSSVRKSDSSPEMDPEALRVQWNSIPGVLQCKVLGKTIRNRISTRIQEYPNATWWNAFFEQVRCSDWLCGRKAGKDGPFQASLDWVLRPENLDKILAGNYDSPKQACDLEPKGCTWSVLNGDGRHHKLCGSPIASDQSGVVLPLCAKHLSERQRLDERLRLQEAAAV